MLDIIRNKTDVKEVNKTGNLVWPLSFDKKKIWQALKVF